MSSRKCRTISTAVLMLVLVTAATRWLLEATEPLRHPAEPEYDALLLALAAWVLIGCAAWTMLIGIAAVVETTSAGVTPGHDLGRLPAFPASGPARRARSGSGGTGPLQSSATASAEAPLPVPTRPVGTLQAGTQPAEDPAGQPSGLVVRRGDSLWRIAKPRLPSSASADEVAALVHRLHHRNRGVIGADPDLIRPGQRLAVPPRPGRSQLPQPTHGR